MRKILFIAAFLSLAVSATAQSSADRKAARAAEKQFYKEQDMQMRDSAFRALQDSMFVLKADRVVFKRGETAYVNSATNFISLQGERAVIQLAFDVPWAGANGLGGITVDGTVTDISVKTDKKGYSRYQMNVIGSGTSWMAIIILNPDDNRANVTVYPTYSSNRVTLNGVLLPYDKRSVFKGRSLF